MLSELNACADALVLPDPSLAVEWAIAAADARSYSSTAFSLTTHPDETPVYLSELLCY